jgi:hypothetical protein
MSRTKFNPNECKVVLFKRAPGTHDHEYVAQLETVNQQPTKLAMSLFETWRACGSGYQVLPGANNKKAGEKYILLFAKDFKTHLDAVKWARTCPYKIVVEHPGGKEKAIVRSPRGPGGAKGQYICSHCGASGHNKRTCPQR